jgi:hypothetical protein
VCPNPDSNAHGVAFDSTNSVANNGANPNAYGATPGAYSDPNYSDPNDLADEFAIDSAPSLGTSSVATDAGHTQPHLLASSVPRPVVPVQQWRC